jgi:hypothetical protein
MLDSNRSVLSRELSVEERQWVRDLANHPGFQLYQQALQELQGLSLAGLLSTDNLPDILRNQGKHSGYRDALALVPRLLQKAQRPQQGR